MGTSDAWNRGRQFVEGPAHCAACHTGRNIAGGLKGSETFAGNDDLPGGSKTPSIRANDLVGKGWTESNLAFVLKLGIVPRGDAYGGSMAEVVTYGTAYLTDTDRAAIATYLLDPDGTGAPTEPVLSKPPHGGQSGSLNDGYGPKLDSVDHDWIRI